MSNTTTTATATSIHRPEPANEVEALQIRYGQALEELKILNYHLKDLKTFLELTRYDPRKRKSFIDKTTNTIKEVEELRDFAEFKLGRIENKENQDLKKAVKIYVDFNKKMDKYHEAKAKAKAST